MCAVHGQDPETFTPASLWNEMSSVSEKTTKPSSAPHAFNLIHRIQSDQSFEFNAPTLFLSKEFHATYGRKLKQLVDEWLPLSAASDPAMLAKKTEEAIWMNTLIYGVGGWTQGKDYVADFAGYVSIDIYVKYHNFSLGCTL